MLTGCRRAHISEVAKLSPESRLAGRVGLVTGASSGIGRAIAKALAAEGAFVHLVGRSRARLDEVRDEIAEIAETGSGTSRAWAVDLAAPDEVEALAISLRAESDTVGLLVHSAGFIRYGTTADTTLADLDEHMAVNLRAPYQLTCALAAQLVEQEGEIVFVNSSAARSPRGQVALYSASKLALEGLANSLRDELNPRGVRVLSVYPGRTASPMQERIHALEGRPYRPERLLQPEDVARAVVGAVTLPRTAEITELRIRPMAAS